MNRIYFLLLLLLGISRNVSASDALIIFEGRYEFRTDDESLEVLGRQVCFYPSGPAAASILRPDGDHRLRWFCFANSRKAAHMFGFKLIKAANSCGSFGNATVTVSNYKRYSKEGDDNDIARLAAVLKKSSPMPLQCQE